MRKFVVLAAIAAVAACSPPQAAPEGAPAKTAAAPAAVASGPGCALSASAPAPGAPLTIEAASVGADCNKAVVVLTIKDQAGEPVHTYAAPYDWMLVEAPADGGLGPADVQAFLDAWVISDPGTTADLPEWPEDAKDLNDGQDGAYIGTPLDRAEYMSFRSQKLPRVCYATGYESMECVALVTEQGGVVKVFESGT